MHGGPASAPASSSEFDFLSDEELQAELAVLGHSKDNPPTRLRVERVRRRLSQGEAAKLIHVTNNHFGGMERGQRAISVELARLIAEKFQMDVVDPGFWASKGDRQVPGDVAQRLLSDSELKPVLEELGFGPDNAPHLVLVERLRRGWTVRQLAERSGVAYDTIRSLEAWELPGSLRMYERLTRAMERDGQVPRLKPIGWDERVPVGLSRVLEGRQVTVAWVTECTGLSAEDLRMMRTNAHAHLFEGRIVLLARVFGLSDDTLWNAISPQRKRSVSPRTARRRARAREGGAAGLSGVPAPTRSSPGGRRGTPPEAVRKASATAPSFGSRLRELRQREGWDVSELARAAGLVEARITELEKRQLPPARRTTVLRLAEAFELESDEVWPGPNAGTPSVLTAKRRERGWSVADLSENSGVSGLTIRALEEGLRRPTRFVREDLAEALDVQEHVIWPAPDVEAPARPSATAPARAAAAKRLPQRAVAARPPAPSRTLPSFPSFR